VLILVLPAIAMVFLLGGCTQKEMKITDFEQYADLPENPVKLEFVDDDDGQSKVYEISDQDKSEIVNLIFSRVYIKEGSEPSIGNNDTIKFYVSDKTWTVPLGQLKINNKYYSCKTNDGIMSFLNKYEQT